MEILNKEVCIVPESRVGTLDDMNETVIAMHQYQLSIDMPYAGFVYHRGQGLYIVYWTEELKNRPSIHIAGTDFDFSQYIDEWEQHPNDYFWLVDYLTIPPAIKLYIK